MPGPNRRPTVSAMKAIVQDRYGSPDVLEFRDVEEPVPADDEVLVRVQAASVNAADWHYMRGDPYLARSMMGYGAPRVKIRGRDFAGTVTAVGANVKRFAPGDEVFGETNGTFAEYVCAREGVVAPKPGYLTFEQAAAIPLAGNTALVGLRDVARVQIGQRVLVNGASGGVGTFAVQLAKSFGAEVTGVCSARNADLVRSIGADRVVDYKKENFTRGTERYHVILDLVGNHSMADLRHPLSSTGMLVLSGGGVSRGGSVFGPMGLILKAKAMSPFARWLAVLEPAQSTENLVELAGMAEAGKVAPVIDRTYPLGEAAAAIRYLETEHARAKVVITV
jgi:NADPH:quinone reductase-like Zn-dependent oxidoreductase